MKEKKTHTIFIDTKIDKNQDPSKFKVRINDWFLRNNIKNNDGAKSEWFLSVKTLSMLNSFSNVSKNINDKIELYVAKDDTKPDLQIGTNDTDYDKYEYIIPEGNPNVIDISTRVSAFLKPYSLECVYDNYDSKFEFKNINGSTDTKKKYLRFPNTYDLLGFTDGSIYVLNNTVFKSFKSDRNVNMMADRLVKFSLGGNSDFAVKDMSYCNHGLAGIFSTCNVFFMMPVNVNPYSVIHYERGFENLIPIELYKNNIREFEIIVTNNDNDGIEGLADWVMVLEFVQIKTWNYEMKIYKILKELYMWVAMTISNKRWF